MGEAMLVEMVLVALALVPQGALKVVHYPLVIIYPFSFIS
jgi:hypothetical protein